MGEWQVFRLQCVADFVRFMFRNIFVRFTLCALNGLPHHGIQGQNQNQRHFVMLGHENIAFPCPGHIIARPSVDAVFNCM